MTCQKQTTGLLLVISGPSGVGKTTIAHEVERRLNGVWSVSATTRPKTDKDTEGRDYWFVTRDEFERRRDAGELLEWAEVFGNFYGTPRMPVEQALVAGRLIIMEIDVQGGVQIKKIMPQALAIFVMPPSENTLLERLRGRGRDTEEVIQKRFAKARAEIAAAQSCGAYDVFVVNDKLEDAIARTVDMVRRHMSGGGKCAPIAT